MGPRKLHHRIHAATGGLGPNFDDDVSPVQVAAFVESVLDLYVLVATRIQFGRDRR
jgi:hypothetical protein